MQEKDASIERLGQEKAEFYHKFVEEGVAKVKAHKELEAAASAKAAAEAKAAEKDAIIASLTQRIEAIRRLATASVVGAEDVRFHLLLAAADATGTDATGAGADASSVTGKRKRSTRPSNATSDGDNTDASDDDARASRAGGKDEPRAKRPCLDHDESASASARFGYGHAAVVRATVVE